MVFWGPREKTGKTQRRHSNPQAAFCGGETLSKPVPWRNRFLDFRSPQGHLR
jgi:hypothetical protein